MTTVLVTGGAGYIGAQASKVLRDAGLRPVVLDNFSTGWRAAVRFGPAVEADLLDRTALASAFAAVKPEAVMHFAALSNVGESVARPDLYWRNNVVGTMNLLEAMRDADCRRLVFSSTAATYGVAEHPLREDDPQRPINPYGASKLAVERMIADFGALGLEAVTFRYFNVAGADPDGETGERHEPETHLVPLLLDAIAGARPEIAVWGDDYGTPDGTCIRDYVHVLDLCEAHLLGLRWLEDGRGGRSFNLGSGRGYSVMEVIRAAERTTGRPAPVRIGPRRAGDPPRLVAAPDRAFADLGWRPRHGLEDMIRHAWDWRTKGLRQD